MRKLGLYILYVFFLIENSCLNGFKVDRIQDYEKKEKKLDLKYFYFLIKVHKQVRRLEALQLTDAQSTGLGWRGRGQKSPLDGAVDL